MLDKLVAKMPRWSRRPRRHGAVCTFSWLAAGTAILIAAILTIAFAVIPARGHWPHLGGRC